MARKHKKPSAYAIFIAVLTILLALAVWLFIYGSMNNGLSLPRLPGREMLSLGTMHAHG